MLLVACYSYSQEKIPFIDFNSIAQQIPKAESNEKKLELINKISKNDSAYYSLLSTKSYYLLQLKKYDEALKVVNEGINSKHKHSKVNFYVNKGVALGGLNRSDEALENYKAGIEKYPKNHLLWYNVGYTLEAKGKLNEAIEAYKKAITYNPFYTKPHLQIGNIFYKQERITQALMCFNMYLLLEPDVDGAFSVLKSLNNVIQAKNSNKRNNDITLNDADDSFEEIDLVLSTKIALNTKYKIDNPINIALTKQNHAMIEQLKNFEGDGGFWDKTYVPFYQWISDNNLFDDFVYTLSYSIENEDYKKIITKNTDKIVAFLGDLKAKWRDLVSINTVLHNGIEQEVIYEYNNSYVNAIGKADGDKAIGFWQFFNESGRLIAEGNFNKEGNKTGKWTWFNSLHNIKEVAHYKNGKLEGENFMNYINDKKYINANYVADSLHGKYEYYNNKGALIHRKYFKNGTLEGDYKSYFKVGEKLQEFYIPYKNGLIDGEVLEFYANGEIYAKSFYVSGKKTGIETVYHYNKKIASEINFVKGELSGSYKSYHPNGKVNEVGQSLEGSYTGSWKSYYSNGILQSEYNYRKGKLHDLYKYFDTDGKLYYEYVYRKGEIIAYTFYKKDGSILKKGKKKGGEFYYEGYSAKGVKTTEGLYDVSGGKIGEWKFYANNGVLLSKGNFKDNAIVGDYFNYYNNGQVEYITPYKEDVIDGYYTSFHLNKKMSSQGWYKDGNQHGEWKYYNIDGTLSGTNFFHNGKLHGIQNDYTADGKLVSTTNFIFDDLISESVYDKDGNLFEKINYESTEKEYLITSKHFNGKPKTITSYVNGVKHGKYELFHFNGNKKVVGTYRNGEQDGLWTWFYEDGKIESKANYNNGKVHGKVVNFAENGKIEGDYTFENDLEIGTGTRFYKTGVKSSTTQYFEGKKHGKKYTFDELGEVQLIRFYHYDEIIGYSYLDKNGTEIAMIPLENETGKIEAFFANGKPSIQFEYKYGKTVSDFKSYSSNGNIEGDFKYSNGKYHGLVREYFLNGKLKEETFYNFSVRQGKNVKYYENGTKKEENTFLNDEKHGISIFYDKSGKIITKKKYFNGKIYNVESF